VSDEEKLEKSMFEKARFFPTERHSRALESRRSRLMPARRFAVWVTSNDSERTLVGLLFCCTAHVVGRPRISLRSVTDRCIRSRHALGIDSGCYMLHAVRCMPNAACCVLYVSRPVAGACAEEAQAARAVRTARARGQAQRLRGEGEGVVDPPTVGRAVAGGYRKSLSAAPSVAAQTRIANIRTLTSIIRTLTSINRTLTSTIHTITSIIRTLTPMFRAVVLCAQVTKSAPQTQTAQSADTDATAPLAALKSPEEMVEEKVRRVISRRSAPLLWLLAPLITKPSVP
jgi:hypothetical protein